MDSKSNVEKRKNRNKRRQIRQRRYILGLSTVLIFVIFFALTNHYIRHDKTYVNAEIESGHIEEKNEDVNISSEENSQIDEVSIDNNIDGYDLENDPNAEDAMEVFHNTEGLLKGTKKYPVRTDNKKIVYLTFDDGPSTENTGDVLDILKEYNIKGTFFVTGKSIDASDRAKELLKRTVKEGHAIGNHSYSHDYKILYPGRTIDANAFMNDIEKCNASIRSVLGENFSTRVIRFPGGYWSWNGRSAIRPIIDEKGYAIMDWNALNEDAQGKTKNAAELVAATKVNVEKLGPDADSIVFLMHDTYGKGETVKALPEIIEYFKSLGFEFRSMK